MMEFNFDLRGEVARIKAETDATFVVSDDDNGTILDASPKAEEIFEYFTRYETIGQSIDILVPERFRESHHRQRTVIFKDDARPRYLGNRDMPIIGLTKSGREIPVLIGLRAAKIFGHSVVIVDVIDMTNYGKINEQRR